MKGRAWSWLSAWSLVWVLGTVACGGGGVPVQSPTSVPATGRTIDQTGQAVLEALPRRGWVAENVQPGRIVAFLAVRKHLLRVEIRYDAQQVAIYYVDSDNLAAHIEGNGVVYAHKKVNMWIHNLATDIGMALAIAPQPGTAGGATNVAPAPVPPSAMPPPPPATPAPAQ